MKRTVSLRLCALAALSGALLFVAPAAQGTSVGTVAPWGCQFTSNHGQCGIPTALVSAIAAGTSHSLGLTGDGTVVAWGCTADDYGQCSVPSGLTGVTAIAAGDFHSLALKSDGTVVAWGCGAPYDFGQCSVPNGLSGVTAISAGTSHSLALKSDGTVTAWGCNGDDYGQCSVPTGLTGVTAIAAGDVHSLALKNDGTVVAWGCGAPYDFGQCNVPTTLAGVGRIAAGDAHSLARVKAFQVITFVQPPAKAYGDPDFTVMAGASSGLPVSFAAIGHCTVSNLTVHLTGAGSCVITAYQPGDATDWNAARGVSRSIAIAKANQTITFGAFSDKTYGDPDFTVSASASSGLPVSLTAHGNCTLSGTVVHLMGAGGCTVTASQAGDANYRDAPVANQSFLIAKANETITFGALPKRTYGDHDFTVAASASSRLRVSFTASGHCTVRAATVHLTGPGSCTITASQPGDGNFNAAPKVSRRFAIAPTPCTPPRVIGKTVAAAKRLIAQRHCRTGKITRAYSRTRRSGTVVAQSRRPRMVLPNNAKIDLVVSRGRK